MSILIILTFFCLYDVYAEYKGHQDYLQDRKSYYDRTGKKPPRAKVK